jgi:hypothetical protein
MEWLAVYLTRRSIFVTLDHLQNRTRFLEVRVLKPQTRLFTTVHRGLKFAQKVRKKVFAISALPKFTLVNPSKHL